MKKIHCLLLLLTGCFLFQSCLKEEEDLFEGTPSERMEKTLKEYRDVLSSAEYGWAFGYYPEANQSYGGYNFALQFTESSVKAFFELAPSTMSEESLYKLTSDDGPVLSFDTYNMFLHYFAEPSPDMYQGLQGDHEFVLMGLSEDKNTIQLKGKKTGNRMTLNRLTESPAEYLGKITAISELFSAPAYGLTVNGQEVACAVSSNVLSYQYMGQDDAAVSGSVAFRYTTTGISFYKETEIAGVSFSELLFADDKMTSSDGSVVMMPVIPPLSQQFANGDWFFAYNQISPVLQPYFNMGKEGSASEGEEIGYMYMGTGDSGYGFNFYSGGYVGALIYECTILSDDEVNLKLVDLDNNGSYYYQYCNYNYIAAAIGDPTNGYTYKLTADDEKNPTLITLTDKADPDCWFTLSSDIVYYPFR